MFDLLTMRIAMLNLFFFQYRNRLKHCLRNTKISYSQMITFGHISLKICAKRVGVIKNKMCVFTIQETFVVLSICQKCQGTQIKAFLCFILKGGWKMEGGLQTAFIWVLWHFWHMLDKTKISCFVKTQILSFISFKMCKKGRGQKR